MARYFMVGLFAVFLTAIGQLLLKTGAQNGDKGSPAKLFFNVYTLAGYFLFIIVTFMNVYVYKYLPLKFGVIFLPFTFIFVSLLSYLFLKERLSRTQKRGALVIICGVVLFNL